MAKWQLYILLLSIICLQIQINYQLIALMESFCYLFSELYRTYCTQGVFSSRKENFGYHIGRLTGCRKGLSDTNEKTNFIIRLETARRIY